MYLIPDDLDGILYAGKRYKKEKEVTRTHKHGRVLINDIIIEKLDTPKDELFKYNPEMRLNK